MNDAQAATGASLLPESTDIFTITVFVLIALFAIGAIAIIVFGARRKRRRLAAEETVQERIEQAGEVPAPEPVSPPPVSRAVTEPTSVTGAPTVAPSTTPIAEGEPTAQPSTATLAPATDDPAHGPVSQLKGLGPKVTARLAELGIATVGDLAALDDAAAARLDAQLGPFAGRMARDRWLNQARLLAAGDRAGFEAVYGKL